MSSRADRYYTEIANQLQHPAAYRVVWFAASSKGHVGPNIVRVTAHRQAKNVKES